MIPIFEEGGGRGIGHDVQSFFKKFDGICDDHITDGRAKAFAFIFYDFDNQEFRKVLHDQGVLTQLNGLIGFDLSIFYLHDCNKTTTDRFNKDFLTRLGIADDVRLPFVAFFKTDDKKICDVVVRHLESPDLIHGFSELSQVIDRYIKEMTAPDKQDASHLRIIRGLKFMGVEAFRAALQIAIGKALQTS